MFRQTETQPVAKEYSDEDRAFIRSRLPVAKALKIGASGLKGEPFRLLATVFLSCVAFILFGLMSTFMMYNPAAVKREAIKNSSEKYFSAVLRREWEPLKIGDTTIANIEKATGITPVGVLQSDNLAFCGDTLKNTDVRYTAVYNPMGAVVYDPDRMAEMGLTITEGTWPGVEEVAETSFGKVRIVPVAISRFHAQMYLDMGLSNYVVSEDPALKNKEPKTYADLVGMPVTFGTDRTSYYKISGVFDCGEIDKAYRNFDADSDGWNLQYKYAEYMQTSLHTALIINAASKDGFVRDNDTSTKMYVYHSNGDSLNIAYQSNVPATLCIDSAGSTVSKIQGNDVFVPYGKIRNVVLKQYGYDNEEIDRLLDSVYDSAETEDGYADTPKFADETTLKRATPEILALFLKSSSCADGTVYSGQTGAGRAVNMNLAGIAYDTEDAESDLCAVSDTFAYSENGAVRDTNEIYKSVLLPIARISEKQLNSLINIDAVEKVDSASALRINTPFIANIDNASELIGTLGKIFLYTGIALAVFAALLLFNFISASIAQKKKEIGILRAVGARGSDVFKIFFAETLILVVVCLVVSLILSAVLCVAINNIIKNQSAFVSYDLLIFGPLNALIIIAIAAAVAVVGTFVPVFLTARKKPVEAIRSL